MTVDLLLADCPLLLCGQFTLEALDFFADAGREWASVLLEVGEAKVSFSKWRLESEVRKVST